MRWCMRWMRWCMRWWCIMMHALMHALMHAWMRMRCSLREYACDAVYVNVHAMQSAWMRMRYSLRECACDTACVNAHAMQFAWMRMRCSLRECACDAVCVFTKSAKPVKSLLPDPNNHYRFQIIMLIKTWFKSVNQLIVSSGINSLDLADEIFCWWKDFYYYITMGCNPRGIILNLYKLFWKRGVLCNLVSA